MAPINHLIRIVTAMMLISFTMASQVFPDHHRVNRMK